MFFSSQAIAKCVSNIALHVSNDSHLGFQFYSAHKWDRIPQGLWSKVRMKGRVSNPEILQHDLYILNQTLITGPSLSWGGYRECLLVSLFLSINMEKMKLRPWLFSQFFPTRPRWPLPRYPGVAVHGSRCCTGISGGWGFNSRSTCAPLFHASTGQSAGILFCFMRDLETRISIKYRTKVQNLHILSLHNEPSGSCHHWNGEVPSQGNIIRTGSSYSWAFPFKCFLNIRRVQE